MAIRGLSNATCSHSHFLHPFCAREPLLLKVTYVFLFVIGAVIGGMIVVALKRSFIPIDPPARSRNKPAPTSTRLPIDGDTPVSRIHHIGPLVLPATQSPLSSTALHPVSSTSASQLKIQSADQIVRLPEIVGIPILVIEWRARPGNENVRGFIQRGDSLLNVITENWQQAEAEHITHAEMADHIRFIIKAARENKGKAVAYDYTTKTSDPASVNTPWFSVAFYKKTEKQIERDIFRKVGEEGESSNEEALIMNSVLPMEQIRWTPIRERYIREYGFYSLGMKFSSLLQVLQKKVVQTE